MQLLNFPEGSLWQFSNCPNVRCEGMLFMVEKVQFNTVYILQQVRTTYSDLTCEDYKWEENMFSESHLSQYVKRIA